MEITFMVWLRNNYPDEIVHDFIDNYTTKNIKDLVNLKPYDEIDVKDYVNFAFAWEFAKFGTTIWEYIHDTWYNYCLTLENLSVKISFGTLYQKEKNISKIEIHFHN